MLNQLMRTLPLLICGSVLMISSSGCGTSRVVFVDTSQDMVRLGPDVRGHVYYLKGGEWIKSKNKVTLPEGWYAGGISKDDEEN